MFIPFDHQKQSLLRHLPSKQIHKMLLSGEFCIQAYPKDTIIHRADDLIKTLEIVIMGEVLLKNHLQEEHRVVQLYDVIYHDRLYQNGSKYNYDIIATEDTLLLSINRHVLSDLLFSNTEFLREYARMASTEPMNSKPQSPLS